MPKKIELYECEGCGSQYKTCTEAMSCEDKHKNVVDKVFLDFEPRDDKIPRTIIVEFEHGGTWVYNLIAEDGEGD